jgi:carotenoid cleavage dioxygenase
VGKTGNGYLAAHGAFRKTSIARHDLESGALDTFSYGEDVIPEEHIFVAKPGSANEDEGWLIGTSLDTAAGVTRVSVFDARHVSAGPIAQGTLPYALPLGFHGQWRPA